MLELQVISHGGRSVKRLSPLCTSPIYIAECYQRMIRHSPSLEEEYSIPLVLRLRHQIHQPGSPPLAFDLILRVHVNNEFALSQYHGLDYLEIHQFRGRKI